MSENLSEKLARIGAESEEYERLHPDAPLPSGTTVTRGHRRAKTLQVRLNDDEYDALENVAAARQLPVSTVARGILLRALSADDSPDAVLANIESEIAVLRTKLAS